MEQNGLVEDIVVKNHKYYGFIYSQIDIRVGYEIHNILILIIFNIGEHRSPLLSLLANPRC